MSHTAARPWWADVQHLRPDEDGANDERPARTGRFDRPTAPARRPSHATERREQRRRERPEPELWLEPSVAEPKPERRTIEIRGQADRVAGVAPVPSQGPQRHRGRMPHERVGPRPDKIALWAVLLGLLLILVAAISSPGADAATVLLAAGL